MSNIKKLLLDGGNFSLDTNNSEIVEFTNINNKNSSFNHDVYANDFVISNNGQNISINNLLSSLGNELVTGYLHIYSINNSLITTISQNNTSYQIQGNCLVSFSKNFNNTNIMNSPSITYTGTATLVRCIYNVSMCSNSSQNLKCKIYFRKNSIAVSSSIMCFRLRNNIEANISMTGIMEISPTDIVDIVIESLDNVGDINFTDISINFNIIPQ